MGQFDIERALIAKLRDVNPGIHLYYENEKAEPPGGAPYALVNVSHDTPYAVTLGKGGEDHHTGFLQVLLKYPLGEGSGEAKELADLICKEFKGGTFCQHEDQTVTVTGSGIGTSYSANSRYTLPITITWYARTRR